MSAAPNANTGMSRRGNDILRSYAERIRQEKDHQHVTQTCMWCAQSFAGDLCDARDWFTQHLAIHHPERQTVRRTQRRSQFRTMGSRPLEENIANARAQGASAWVNDGETI